MHNLQATNDHVAHKTRLEHTLLAMMVHIRHPGTRDQAVFLHGKHRGVQALGTRALDALWGGDKLGLKQKEAPAALLKKGLEAKQKVEAEAGMRVSQGSTAQD